MLEIYVSTVPLLNFQAQKAVSFLVSHGRPFRTKLDNKLNAIYKTNQCPFKVDLKTTVPFNSCFPFLVCIPFPMQAVQWNYFFLFLELLCEH